MTSVAELGAGSLLPTAPGNAAAGSGAAPGPERLLLIHGHLAQQPEAPLWGKDRESHQLIPLINSVN